MQLQFLAPVELFFQQLNGCNYNFFDLQFFPLCEIRPKAADAQITSS